MSAQNPTILIVEDDEVDVERVIRGLRKRELAFNVHTSSNGLNALLFLREEMPREERSKLIVLLDLNMPNMNGHEFLDELRSDAELCKALVFVLTTSSLPSDCSRAYEKNVAGYFVKSDVDALLDVLGTFANHVMFPDLSLSA